MELRLNGAFIQLSKEDYDDLVEAKAELGVVKRMIARHMVSRDFISLEMLAEVMGIETTKKDATGQD